VTARRRRIARLEHHLADTAFPELHSKGLAMLLPFLHDDDGSDDIDADRNTGLAQLLRYEPPEVKRPSHCVTE
jgi:hypothetical protein